MEAFDNGGFDPFPDLALAELCAVHALRGEWNDAYGYAKEIVAFHADGSLPPMGLTGWYETEALLQGGDDGLARAEAARIARTIKSDRYRLPLLRSQAVLAEWDEDVTQAIAHLEAAPALAQEIGLPGEEWMILRELGRLHAEQEDEEKTRKAYGEAGTIIHRLAETIDDETLREGFLTAALVRSVLEINEGGRYKTVLLKRRSTGKTYEFGLGHPPDRTLIQRTPAWDFGVRLRRETSA